MYDLPGDDDLDEVCKNHDLGYDTYGRDNLSVDKRLVEELKQLDPDPKKWRNPPATDEDVKYAKYYRKFAISWFSRQIAVKEMLKAIQEHTGSIVPDVL